MAYENGTFSIRRGDDRTIEIAVSELNGVASQLDGIPIRWTYGRTANGPAVLIKTQNDATVTVAPGKIRIRFTSEETEALEVYASYRYQCRATFDDGRETLATGSFTVEPSQR